MATASEWVLVNKVKTGLGIVAALIPIILVPISIVAWADDKVRESEIRQEARTDVLLDTVRNKHAYDFFAQEAEDAEEDLVELEQQVAEGVTLLPSQVRKMDKLTRDIERYEAAQEQALERLSNPETEDATE